MANQYNKSDLVQLTSKELQGTVSQVIIGQVYTALMTVIREVLETGDSVLLQEIGVLDIRYDHRRQEPRIHIEQHGSIHL